MMLYYSFSFISLQESPLNDFTVTVLLRVALVLPRLSAAIMRQDARCVLQMPVKMTCKDYMAGNTLNV